MLGAEEPLPACFCRAGRTAGLPAMPRPVHRAAGCGTGLRTRARVSLAPHRSRSRSVPSSAGAAADPAAPGQPSALTRRPRLSPALAVRRLRGADGGPGLLGNTGGGGPEAGAARASGEVRLGARPAGALRREGVEAMGRSAGPRAQPPRGEAVPARPRRAPAEAPRRGSALAATVPARPRCAQVQSRGSPAAPARQLPALTRCSLLSSRWHRSVRRARAVPPRQPPQHWGSELS